jgi:arylsulfatase A-like enzyme
MVVFTSDHGEWLGEHRRFGKGYWAPDVVSRVPLIVSVPERMGGKRGEQVTEIVECVDVVPTLLRLAGIPVPPDVQGDVLPVTGALAGEAGGDGLGLTEQRGWRSLRMDGFRYVALAGGEEHLYDLSEDPWEYRDVVHEANYRDALTEARHALVRRMIEIEQPLPREWPY